MSSFYIKNKNYIVRGSRCYGIPIDDTRLIYIRGIHSWPMGKLRSFLESQLQHDLLNTILSIRRITNLNDNFFKIKVLASESTTTNIINFFQSKLQHISIAQLTCSRKNHKTTLSSQRTNMLINSDLHNSSTNSVYSQPTSSASLLHSNNTISQQSNVLNQSDNFSFCLSWNTDGWNHGKKDSIKYFIAIYKPLFLCFQETGNGSGSNSRYPCKISIPNYKYFFKKADDSIPGKRGLFLGYHKSCQASFDSPSYEYIISLNTYNLWGNQKCSIGNIYVPQRRHTVFVKAAKVEIISWLQNHSSNPSILLGDFNLSINKLNDLISSLDNWMILPLNGSNISWNKGFRQSAIDHAVINNSMLNLISYGSFIDYPPISDHKPLLVFGKSFSSDNTFTSPKKFVRWNRVLCTEKKELIADNNYFRLLESEILNNNSSSDELSKSFISTAHTIANELDITSTEEIRRSFFHISQKIFNLHRIKVRLYKDIKRCSSSNDIDNFSRLISRYQRLCLKIHKACNEFRKLEYQHWIASGCEYIKSHNPRKAWKWIKITAKVGKFLSAPSHSILNKDGVLVSSTKEVLDVWHDHYKNLASDPSGTSISSNTWINPPQNEFLVEYRDIEWDINQDISADEIRSAISSTPNFKASGPDDIPIEFFKALISDYDDNDDTNNIPSTGLNCLLLLYNRIWNGDFPNSWNEASIVSIPKKGDLTDCDNYRGISLINNGIKLITKVITNRISDYGLKHGFIRPEQFGFRNKEECVSLYISLREICQRRKFNNQETYLAFLDLKKAYDSVPIGNILCKIYRLGIRGKCFQFIKNLYLSSKAKVKVDNEYSNSFNIMKGVRQGCPLSPILFNLFINDIFNGCNELGVPIDGNLCCGGLFADDIVLCAPTRTNLKKMLKMVNKWAMYNKMTFGINKCATMVVRPDSPQNRYRRDPTFYLAGQPLPITDCYTYLGIPFDKSLSLKPIIKNLNNKVRKALFSVGGFLRNSRIPLPFKKSVINAFIISKVSYFAPLLGSNKINSSGAQVYINKSLYWAAGVHNAKSIISLYSISKDFNIPPLSAKCALMQTRCFNKWKSSNCIISSLVNNVPKIRKHTWTKQSKILNGKLQKIGDTNAIINFYWERDVKRKSIKAEFYDNQNFNATNKFMDLCYDYPELSLGFQGILKARCGYKLDARVAKAAKLITMDCPNYCPCCNSGTQTIEHWLIKCPAFLRIRLPVSEILRKILHFFVHNSSTGPNDNNSNNSFINNNSVINNLDNSLVSNTVYNNSSVLNNVFIFLLGGRPHNFNSREWKNLCDCQIKSGNSSDTPFLVVTAALLNYIIPIASGRQRSLFNRYKTNHTKSVNAEITVRQASRASATNNDHNFVT